MMLLVAGNEQLPDGSRNQWNNKKSKKLLQFSDVEFSDSDSEPDSDSEDPTKQELKQVKKELKEYTSSRKRRLDMAKQIGVSKAPLNFAQLNL